MESLDLAKVREYVYGRIAIFHERHAQSIQGLALKGLMRQNPHLYRASPLLTVAALIEKLLDDYLSASEEHLFGRFLADLAVFVTQHTCNGYRSAAEGVDVEFVNRGVHFLVSVKSALVWSNMADQNQLEQNLKAAAARVNLLPVVPEVQPVLGICFGRASTGHVRNYRMVVGQDFWYLLSECRELYAEIVEPLRFCTKERGRQVSQERPHLVNRLMREFLAEFCHASGAIHWPRLVDYVDEIHDGTQRQLAHATE